MKKTAFSGKRDYMSVDENRYDFNFDTITTSAGNLSEAFWELTGELSKTFSIDKAVLILRKPEDDRLAAVSTWRQGQVRDGLTISLPCQSSLFEKVAEHGQVYTENFTGSFSGNLFEQRLLLDDSSRSFVVHPLKAEGRIVGFLGFSSEQPTAFTVMEEGALEELAAKFGSFILNTSER
ncbi:MAG: GAF domain-containing protein [candidate division Zixibacteria bacterium]|nr:GAF domain-containing protein [candidate division Zixibacteria bacterium]